MSKSKGNIIDPLDLVYGISQDELVDKRTANLMQEGLAEKIEKKTRNQFPKGIESYGTDALRMAFFSMATHTKDISFEFGRLKVLEIFVTKYGMLQGLLMVIQLRKKHLMQKMI